MNPHFIFNAINNIQNLVNQGSKEQASEYLATLSIMIRQNIENLQFSFIPLQKELNLVQNYIELQNLRYNNNIRFDLNSEVSADIKIPPLLIHTFVENSIVHGYSKKDQPFYISLSVELTDNDYLLVSIVDNGIGIKSTEKNMNLAANKVSLGISFTEKRLKRLSEFYNVQYSLNLEEVEPPESGTRVSIMIYAKFHDFSERS